MGGSSPLTRGKRTGNTVDLQAAGLIPTHAGKTACSCAAWTRRRAHPHSRGENHRLVSGLEDAGGSSPLTRGKPRPLQPIGWRGRLIPAHAGKTRGTGGSRPSGGAHPRSRGENLLLGTPTPVALGSSPLTRGKPRAESDGEYLPGLIPAHAGKTRRTVLSPTGDGAHPRSRGENPPRSELRGAGYGSSPLTRGKPPAPVDAFTHSRLIPAHAGKTCDSACVVCAHRAHPRSRGENSPRAPRSGPSGGSSPLTRGKPNLSVNWVVGCGLIPAHAGKTQFRADLCNTRTAHPRSRGENWCS